MPLKNKKDIAFFESLVKDYNFLKNKHAVSPKTAEKINTAISSQWGSRLKSWFNKLSNGKTLCEIKLSNFRRLSILLSEVPRNPYASSLISGPVYEFLRRPGYSKTCLHNYNKLKDEQGLDWEGFSLVGNPLYEEMDGRLFNERFLRHLRTIKLVNKYIHLEKNDLIVDVGSNDGNLLSNFKDNHKVLGVTPEKIGKIAIKKGIPTIIDYFDNKTSKKIIKKYGKAKIITATNVFAHIDNINNILLSIKKTLKEDGVFISESHYLLPLIQTVQYDTIYHEHLRYYSCK